MTVISFCQVKYAFKMSIKPEDFIYNNKQHFFTLEKLKLQNICSFCLIKGLND